MELPEFKALFASHPDKYPMVLERRHPMLLDKILAHWDTPIEAEVFFSRLASDISNAGPSGFPAEAAMEVATARELHREWRIASRPKASLPTLKNLGADQVPSILTNLRRPTADVSSAMRSAFALAQADSPDIALWLAERELSPNQRDMDGLSPLMICAQRGCERSAIALLKAGANPHLPDSMGNTALHWAVIQNRRRLAEMLLYFGANPNTPNASGASPYALSVIKEDSTLAQRLYEYGADVASQDALGNTPLHKAIAAKSHDNVWLLLQAGAPHSARNKAGVAAMEMAEKNPDMQRLFDKHAQSLKMSAL
jgi:hypothetical protein